MHERLALAILFGTLLLSPGAAATPDDNYVEGVAWLGVGREGKHVAYARSVEWDTDPSEVVLLGIDRADPVEVLKVRRPEHGPLPADPRGWITLGELRGPDARATASQRLRTPVDLQELPAPSRIAPDRRFVLRVTAEPKAGRAPVQYQDHDGLLRWTTGTLHRLHFWAKSPIGAVPLGSHRGTSICEPFIADPGGVYQEAWRGSQVQAIWVGTDAVLVVGEVIETNRCNFTTWRSLVVFRSLPSFRATWSDAQAEQLSGSWAVSTWGDS